MERIVLAQPEEIPAGQARVFEAKGFRALLVRVGEEVHALQPTCPHRGCNWDGAVVEGEILSCPRCRFRYSARTGLNPLTTACHVNQSTAVYHYRNFPEGKANLYEVKTVNNEIQVATTPTPFVKVIV